MITVVGIGADGWDGLTEPARDAIRAATEVIGSERQLQTLPADAPPTRPWPRPMTPLLDELTRRPSDAPPLCVLASGDPMLHGIGATLARRLGPARVNVISHPSAFALACGRLGWPAAGTELVSTVDGPIERVARLLQTGRRVIVYATGRDGAARIAALLVNQGFGASHFTVLEQLGGPKEHVRTTTANEWGDAAADPLHIVAIEVGGGAGLPLTPGLPDDAYAHDGQLTKRHIRAVTIAALAPRPGELLWDVGAGSGSIAIEWLRAEPRARAAALERDPARAARIRENALMLGVPELTTHEGAAPEALPDLPPAPSAIFIGGGLTAPGVLGSCWEALAPGGRLVANAVTLESEALLTAARRERGGTLVRLAVAHAEPIGGFTGWRPQLPVVQWEARKPAGEAAG